LFVFPNSLLVINPFTNSLLVHFPQLVVPDVYP